MLDRQIQHPVYIKDDETLERFCRQWAEADMLALDTEFIRTDTFYPIGALIQISDGESNVLIDPLALSNLTPLADLLVNEKVVKVLHACSEDLEVFDRLLGVLPSPLIDTQIAAGLDGLGFSIGYQRMTEDLLQVHVPKGETRSNWLQRPLTDSQIHYAALDVAYLPEMYRMMVNSLSEKGRLEWLEDESRQLVGRYKGQGETEHYYKRVKSAWKLDAQQTAVLQSLTMWRENMAREKDIPRGRVIKDRSCLDIARTMPKDTKALGMIDDVGPGIVRRYGEQILDVINDGWQRSSDSWPERLPAPLPPQLNKKMKMLKAHVAKRAEHLNLAAEILVKKKDYEALIRSGLSDSDYQLPDSLTGWRKDVIGNDLIASLKKDH